MAEDQLKNEAEAAADAPRKGKSRSLLVSLVLSLVLGGGGFYAVYSGMLPLAGMLSGKEAPADAAAPDGRDAEGHAKGPARKYSKPAFVPLDPFLISLSEAAASRHLKISLTIEVVPGTEDQVAAAKPRINDVLNTYLRAVDQKDFEVPRAMLRLRAQMLRRVRLVTPPDAVRDLLFQEFVLN